MAQGSGQKARKAPFNYAALTQIQTNLQDILRNYLTQITPVLSEQDYIDGYFMPGHADAVKKVLDIVGQIAIPGSLSTKLYTTDGRPVSTTLTFGGTLPLLPPLYANQGLAAGAPDNLRARLTEYADECVRAGTAFGYVWNALLWLNSVCDRAATIKIMLPVLPVIMQIEGEDGHKLSKKAEALMSATSFGELPRLSPASRKAIQDASTFVSACTLVRGREPRHYNSEQAVFLVPLSSAPEYYLHPDDSSYVPYVM